MKIFIKFIFITFSFGNTLTCERHGYGKILKVEDTCSNISKKLEAKGKIELNSELKKDFAREYNVKNVSIYSASNEPNLYELGTYLLILEQSNKNCILKAITTTAGEKGNRLNRQSKDWSLLNFENEIFNLSKEFQKKNESLIIEFKNKNEINSLLNKK